MFLTVFSRVKAANSELVIVHLLKSYCLPFLLYAPEAVLPTLGNIQSLDNCINRAIFKIFGLGNNDCIQAVRYFVGLPSLKVLIESRRCKFVNRLLTHNQCASLFLAGVVY